MTTNPTLSTDNAASALGAAVAASDLITRHADWAEQNGRQHPDVVERLAESGLHRMSVPIELGGLGLPLVDTFAVLETIAAADASAGWCLMVGSEVLGPLVGHLPADTGRRFVADNPTVTVSGAASAIGIAEPVDGGYRVNGHWTFGSGFHGAQYWMGGCKVVPKSPDGGNYVLAVMPTNDVTPIDGTWNVNGLIGTGSIEVQAADLFVPATMIANTTTPATVDIPLYRVPLPLRWAYPKAAIAVGVATGAVRTFIDLAGGKTPKGERSTLAERPRAQIAAAEATALVHQARAWCNETLSEVWDLAVEGRPVPDETYALFRLSCSTAVQRSVEAVDLVHAAAGSTPNFKGAPLERAWRDVHAIPGQIQAAPHLIEAAGRQLLGLDPGAPIY